MEPPPRYCDAIDDSRPPAYGSLFLSRSFSTLEVPSTPRHPIIGNSECLRYNETQGLPTRSRSLSNSRFPVARERTQRVVQPTREPFIWENSNNVYVESNLNPDQDCNGPCDCLGVCALGVLGFFILFNFTLIIKITQLLPISFK